MEGRAEDARFVETFRRCFFFLFIPSFFSFRRRNFYSEASIRCQCSRAPLRSERVNRWTRSIVRNGKVDLSDGIRNCILSLLLGDDLTSVLPVKVRETNRQRDLSRTRECTTDWRPRDRFTDTCSTIILSDSLACKLAK